MSTEIPRSQPGDPVWEIATLFSPQGQWTASEYREAGYYGIEEVARGQLLPDLRVVVKSVFDQKTE